MNKSYQMKGKSDAVLQSGLQQTSRRYSGVSSVDEIFGFPVSSNQFSTLSNEQATTSQQTTQREGLIDPRTTRRLRWTRQRAEGLKARTTEALSTTVSIENAQGICTTSGSVINPVAIQNSSQLFHSFSADPSDNFAVQSVGQTVQYMLEPGVSGGGDYFLYGDSQCNKRISYAGPERSAGRPGHTPTRRDFACVKHVEDSCAGQEWSAGRPGLTPFGARTAACLSPQTACIGPYGTAVAYSGTTQATTPVRSNPLLLHHHERDYPDMRNRAPVSQQQRLQVETPPMIARHQRGWHCIRAGHRIIVEA